MRKKNDEVKITRGIFWSKVSFLYTLSKSRHTQLSSTSIFAIPGRKSWKYSFAFSSSNHKLIKKSKRATSLHSSYKPHNQHRILKSLIIASKNVHLMNWIFAAVYHNEQKNQYTISRKNINLRFNKNLTRTKCRHWTRYLYRYIHIFLQ